jgi:TPP-dependent pyruvate/acetoin dehydrogenase alpha subunit
VDSTLGETIEAEVKSEVAAAIAAAEKAPPPHTDTLFSDVYAELTPDLVEQRDLVRGETGERDNEGAFPL